MAEATDLITVGIDWGSQHHQVVVLAADRQVLGERTVAHTGPALQDLVQWLLALAAGRPLAVAIEVPRGAIVDTLLEHGIAVFALHPRQLDRFRDRYSAAGAKDDRRDALVLASALATDRAAFRPLQADDPQIIRLRELTRLEAELGDDLRRATNRLRDQLLRFYPQALELCPAADERWFWALLRRAPTPADAAAVSLRTLRALLRAARIRRLTPEAVRAALQVPPLTVAPGTTTAASEYIALLLPRLELLARQQRTCQRRIEGVLQELAQQEDQRGHRDVTILRSLPGVGRIVTATMLTEAARLLADRDYPALRAYTGVAPITRQSGKRRSVAMRYACNARLRNAMYFWAFIAVQHDPRSARHYKTLRARGHSQGRALRSIADRLLAMLIVMLKTQTVYDPQRRALPDAA